MNPKNYKPTSGDLAFDKAFAEDVDDFEIAMRLQAVSDTYLSVLAHDHVDNRSTHFMAMVEFEIQRRGNEPARQANKIAKLALVVSVGAAIVSVVSCAVGS